MTMFLFVNLSRECKSPHGVAYKIPAGCFVVDMLAAVLLDMEQIISNPHIKGWIGRGFESDYMFSNINTHLLFYVWKKDDVHFLELQVENSDVPNVVFTVAWDLFPRTLNISSTPVLFFCSSVVHFCKKEACIKLLFSGDVAENDVAVEHYLTEDVTKQMLSFDKFPEEHVHEVCIQFYFNAMK